MNEARGPNMGNAALPLPPQSSRAWPVQIAAMKHISTAPATSDGMRIAGGGKSNPYQTAILIARLATMNGHPPANPAFMFSG